MTRLASGFLAVLITASGCVPEERAPRVRSQALVAPADSVSFFEPHIAIDPEDSERIVLGAHYGSGYNRGGLHFRVWASANGGRMWRDTDVTPRTLRRTATMAADIVLTYADQGEALLLGLSGDSARHGVPDAALALAAGDGLVFEPRSVLGEVHEFPESGPPDPRGSLDFEVSDKPWMTVDRGHRSPFGSRVYVAFSRVHVQLDLTPPSITRRLELRSSDDAGRTFSAPSYIDEEAMGVQLATGPDGTLDLLWLEGDETASRIRHASSSDGGATFSAGLTVAATPDSATVFQLPTMAANQDGALLACWTAAASSGFPSTVWCSTLDPQNQWSEPAVATAEADVKYGYPSVASSQGTWWLLAYGADTLRTNVLLFASPNGETFSVKDTLATMSLSQSSLCAGPMLPCRRDLAVFTPGDYVGLAGVENRLAAAYVLPERDPRGPGRVWVSVIDP